MTKTTLTTIALMTAAAPALAHGDHGTGLETVLHFALSADHLLGAVVGAVLTLVVIGGLKWLRRAR
ncbi:hypothetical protein [Cognatishimia sp. MH4019]|uniref:hypothetical protein n=1 Tax=Cognatishimia sp. MH4019 TaxID=2854030 RepID=UPI001CD4117A|nr:hypothetical protein [Cognatishimia sp. MH4019]